MQNTIYDFINLSKYAKRTQTTTNFDCGENARDARRPKKQRQRQRQRRQQKQQQQQIEWAISNNNK